MFTYCFIRLSITPIVFVPFSEIPFCHYNISMHPLLYRYHCTCFVKVNTYTRCMDAFGKLLLVQLFSRNVLIHLNRTTWACVLRVPMRSGFRTRHGANIQHYYSSFFSRLLHGTMRGTVHTFILDLHSTPFPQVYTLPQTFFNHFQTSSAFSSPHYYTIISLTYYNNIPSRCSKSHTP